MRDLSDLYYECHVTIDPVFGGEREALEEIISPFKFKLAKLVMFKGSKGDDWVDSEKDTFFTAHSKSYSDLQNRMTECIKSVQDKGYLVRRFKIEDTIIDSRHKDTLNLLGGNRE